MSFLTPIAFIGALLAIPVILLYMLRLRRREVVVSSTFLWQQIIRDNEANTPWQRLRRNLLLLLQLIILALIVFALARPFIVVPAVSTGQIELLVDASASMNATDMPDGSTRFDEAKRQALSMVDTLGINDTMTIIRVADVPEVILPTTGDPVALHTAINNLQPSKAQADWVAALTLASADAVGTNTFNMVIISDGGLGDASGLPGVPGTPRYIKVGQSDSNLAITALATRPLSRPDQPPQLFAQITNYGSQDANVIFNLRVDGELSSAENYAVPANQSVPIVYENLPQNFTTIQAGLTIPVESTVPDYLADDNTAWAVSSGAGNRGALVVTDNNLFLDQALRSLPTIQTTKSEVNKPLPTAPYDLYILDSWLPTNDELPDGDLLLINPPRSTSLFTVGAETDQTGNIQVQQNDPRMNYVDFDNVSILKFNKITADWADELVTADGGPLLLAGEQNGRQIAILTFDVHNSNLPLLITWPILLANLTDWFTPSEAISVPNGLQVGQSLPIRPPFDASSLRFTLPDNAIRDFPIDRDTIVFADTALPGLYKTDVLKGSDVIQTGQFAVNLFAPAESNIAPHDNITLSGNVIAPAIQDEVGQREFWPWAALLALLVLLIEWFVYQRRMQVRTVFKPTLRRRQAG